MAGRIKRARSRGGSPPGRARKTRRVRYSFVQGGKTTGLMDIWLAQGDESADLRIEQQEHECPKCGGIRRITDVYLRVREHRKPKDRREDEKKPRRAAPQRMGALGRVAATLSPASYTGRRAKKARRRTRSNAAHRRWAAF